MNLSQVPSAAAAAERAFSELELELELIQPQVIQKPMRRSEVSSRARRLRGQTGVGMWASAGSARNLGELTRLVKPVKARLWFWGQLSLLWCSPVGAVQGNLRLRFVSEAVHDVL